MGHRSAPRVPGTARWTRWLAPILLVLIGSGCSEGAPTDAFELSGVVTVLLESGDTGGPVPNAEVRFVSDTLIVSETETDDSGRYRMRVLTDHPFGQVVANAPGFREEEETVYFDTQRRRVDLALRRVPGDD
jgi:hypothetical protein